MSGANLQHLLAMVLYMAAVVGIGIYFAGRANKDAESYFLGGRSLGPWVTAFSAEASDMSGYLLMGLPGLAYWTGLADAGWTCIGLAIGTYLNFLIVSKRLRRYSIAVNAFTLPDFFSNRFHEKKKIIMTICSLIIIIFFNNCRNRYLRMSSIVIGLAVGYIVAWTMGMIDFSAVKSYGGFYLPTPFKFGIGFSLSAFISLSIIFVITAIESYGDITANSMISGEPVEGEKFMQRASGGVIANGVSSLLAAALNSFPNSIFAQNNGMIQLTGVASRYVGYFISVMLVLLGVFPAISLVFSLMPQPVLGGATLLMFGTVAATGIRIIASQQLGRKEILVIAISLAGGLSVEFMPEILNGMPEELRNIMSSGITTGGVLAILSNLLIRVKKEE